MRNYFGIVCLLFFLVACSNKKQKRDFYEHKVYAMGTTVMIEYDKNAGDLSVEIDKILKGVEKSIVLADSSSLLSRINRNDSLGMVDEHFIALLNLSKRIHHETQGAFDPTSYGLKQYWGTTEEKYKTQHKLDSNLIDSLKASMGIDQLMVQGNLLSKKNRHVILDFENIYKGYAVDLVTDLFNSYQVPNYRIEIGGMIKAKGLNAKDKPWQIGMDEPTDNPKSRQLMAIATLNNEAYASAGSYRQYYTRNGMKYSFTIDPLSGYPVNHSLLAVYVFAPTCVEAEAYANAFMVMGAEKTKAFLNTHPQIQVYMISNNYKGEWLTFISDGLSEKLEFVKEEAPI